MNKKFAIQMLFKLRTIQLINYSPTFKYQNISLIRSLLFSVWGILRKRYKIQYLIYLKKLNFAFFFAVTHFGQLNFLLFEVNITCVLTQQWFVQSHFSKAHEPRICVTYSSFWGTWSKVAWRIFCGSTNDNPDTEWRHQVGKEREDLLSGNLRIRNLGHNKAAKRRK